MEAALLIPQLESSLGFLYYKISSIFYFPVTALVSSLIVTFA